MIQILKQRKIFDKKKQKDIWPMFFPKKRLDQPTVQHLFANIDDIVSKVPKEERYNLHYTLSECDNESKRPRVPKRQNTIAFDVDKLDISRIDAYIPPVLKAIGNLNFNDVGIVSSGRGLHFVVCCVDYFGADDNYFKATKKYYKIICDRINRRLKALGLPGETDQVIWSSKHTLRLPQTMNVKNPETGYAGLDFSGKCELLQRNITPLPLDIISLAGGEDIPKGEDFVAAKSTFVGGSLSVDTAGILDGCEFLKWMNENQEQVREPQWYAGLSVVAHLKDGRKLAHQFSENHPGYSFDETEDKIDQALTVAGPRTCDNIAGLWDGCQGCKYYEKRLTSPISIKTESFIATRATGFRSIKMEKSRDEAGNVTYKQTHGPIVYQDLMKFFEEKNPFVSTKEELVYTFNGIKWEYVEDSMLKSFCQMHVKPAPKESERVEFTKLIIVENRIDKEWFLESTFKRLNLANGVLDLREKTPKLLPHSADFGFLSALDYEYDPDAKCPKFDQFMKDVTLGKEDLEKVLLEFAGYAFSNDECLHEKALILLGDGSNGKSTYLDVLTQLAGEDNISALSMKDLSDPVSRGQLQGKLFNLAEETPNKSFVDSSDFKNVVTGGTTMVRVLYKGVFPMKSRAKLMMAANDLPSSSDFSHGFFRRLMVVPFDACFSAADGTRDRNIKKKLYLELPGILNRILEAYRRLEAQGDFTNSLSVNTALEEYKDTIDPVKGFVKSRLEISDDFENDDREKAADFTRIYKEYANFMEDSGYRYTMSSPMLSKVLIRYIDNYKERRCRFSKKGVVKYLGVRFTVGEDCF